VVSQLWFRLAITPATGWISQCFGGGYLSQHANKLAQGCFDTIVTGRASILPFSRCRSESGGDWLAHGRACT
jgi:hypothetical protein